MANLHPSSLSACAQTSRAFRALASTIVKGRRLDLSQGQEKVAVRCENYVDGEPFPNVIYSKSCHSADPRLREALIHGCKCRDGGCCSHTCACCALAPPAYDSNGLLIRLDAAVVVECSSFCGCDEHVCRNRVVSRGLALPLVVFKTSTRGWGLRTEAAIERGRFVCEYAGEILSTAAACRRYEVSQSCGGHNYVMSVREHSAGGHTPTMVTTIDPTEEGNLGRFINHSCDPNLSIVLVRAGSFVPHVAFFANRKIPPGEELTFFYGDASSSQQRSRRGRIAAPWAHQSAQRAALQKSRICLCGSTKCLGFLPSACSNAE